MNKLEIIQKIVDEKQCQKVKWNDGTKNKSFLIDLTTAHALLTVYNALSKPGNKEHFLSLPWDKMVSITWSLIK